MRSICDTVHEFADGELTADDREAFEGHLAGCATCGRELEAIFALRALAETAAVSDGASERTRELPAFPGTSRRLWLWGGGLGLAAAAAVVVVPRLRSTADGPWLAAAEHRPLEARLSDPRADRHRPYDRLRGLADRQAPPRYALLEELERRGDVRGLVDGWLLGGEVSRARELLASPLADRQLGPRDLDNERAVVALLEQRPEEALRWLNAMLAREPRVPQALWNRGLALRALYADQAAAAAFEAVSALDEPGWADEARRLAVGLRAAAGTHRRQWELARQEAARLATEPPSEDAVAGYPDLLRASFYEAVRSAGSAAALDRLAPTARALDRQQGDGTALADALDRIRRSDLRRRAPLSAAYADLRGRGWPAAAVTDLVAGLRRAGPGDLLLGVLLATPALARPGELAQLARDQHDPWLDAAAVEATTAGPAERLEQAAEEAARHRLASASLRLHLAAAYLLAGQQRTAEAEPLLKQALLAAQQRGLATFVTPSLRDRALAYRGASEVARALADEIRATPR